MTEISDDKANERKIRIIIIIHKRQNKNIKVCRQSRADLNYIIINVCLKVCDFYFNVTYYEFEKKINVTISNTRR